MDKVIHKQYWNENKLKRAMQHYDFWAGHALVGGLFLRSQLLEKHDFITTYQALQKSFEKQSPRIMSILQVSVKALGFQLKKELNV